MKVEFQNLIDVYTIKLIIFLFYIKCTIKYKNLKNKSFFCKLIKCHSFNIINYRVFTVFKKLLKFQR